MRDSKSSKRTLLLLVGLCFVLASCSKKNEGAEGESERAKLIKSNELGKDFLLPSSLWDKLSGLDLKAAVQQSGTVVYLPISVILREKNPGVLVKPTVVYEFGKGGGDLDLAQATTGKVGSFFVQFRFQGFENPNDLQIYFVSAARKRQVEGAIWGSGCNRYMDIKNFILSQNTKMGVETNTYQFRHITLLSGHFVFSTSVSKQVLVTQVSVFDSTQPSLRCQDLLQKRRSRNVSSAFDPSNSRGV